MASNGTEREELSLKLCRVRESEISDDAMQRWESLENKPAALEYDKKIDDAETETFWNRLIPERKYNDDVRISRWRQWARNRGFEIPLKKSEISGNNWLVLPEIFLTLNEDGQLKGFFPCSDGETGYSVEWVLNCLEDGQDWEKWEDNESTLSYRDSSPIHGAIKSYIKGDAENLLEDEWIYYKEERPVGEDGWRADLVFKHESDSRYNLVEIKPSKDTRKVDKAFGQLFRYRHAFLNDKVNVGVGDIELTIAAPDFYDSHKEAAEELGINLVYTPYSEFNSNNN